LVLTTLELGELLELFLPLSKDSQLHFHGNTVTVLDHPVELFPPDWLTTHPSIMTER
jgi:hypothetical protein